METYCASVSMQRYWWPGYEMQLLEKLQRQQNNSQFCDTLLQTEGISIPTHSCILAALSPYLSERLSASPSPLFGQKRQLKLQTVKAQTLLKLVGLIYSGEVEVKVGVEQNDLLSAAIKFGITDLIEGQKRVGVEEGRPQGTHYGSCRERNDSRGVQDAEVQAEMVERRAADSQVRMTSCVPTGILTVSSSSQTEPPLQSQSEYPLAQNMDFFVTLSPQNIAAEKNFNTLRSPPIPSIPSESVSDEESELDRSFDSVTDPTATWSNSVFTFSFNGDSNSQIPQGNSPHHQSPVSQDLIELGSEEQETNSNAADKSRKSAEQPSFAKTAEVPGEEKAKTTEERSAHAGRKSLEMMKQMAQMVETTQISIKVKLVRTQGEMWEVVSMQNAETLSALSSLKQTAHTNTESSSLQLSPAYEPETPTFQPATGDASEPPPPPLLPPSTTADSQLGYNNGHSLNQSDQRQGSGQSQGPGEDSDEQIEKLLEDVMMGLNIMPNLEGDCKNSHHPQPGHDRVQAVCHALVSDDKQAQSVTHAAVSEEGCVYYQDCRTQISLSSTDSDQTQSTCFSPSSLQLATPQCHPSDTFMGQDNGTSPRGTPAPRSPNCSFTETLAARPVTPTAFYSACQELSSQHSKDILELLPPTSGNKAHPSHSFSSPCMGDLHLPQCLSPLEPFALVAKCQPLSKDSSPLSCRIQSEPSPHGRPLPIENPKIHCCKLGQTRTDQKSPQNLKSRVGFNLREMAKDLLCTKDDPTGDVAAQRARKEKRLGHPEDAADSQVAPRVVEVGDGIKSQINLSACSVSLSSNNVLAKEREMAVSSTDKSSGQSRGTWNFNIDRVQIRTRGFLKKSQEAACHTSRKHSSVLKPKACKAKTVSQEEGTTLKRKRGRPTKKRSEEQPAVVGENKSHAVPRDQQSYNNLTREEEGEKKRRRKQRRNRSEVEVVPRKRTRIPGKAEVDDNYDATPLMRKHTSPKRTGRINLKGFQKFVKHQSSKIRKSNKSQDRNMKIAEMHDESSENLCKLIKEKDAAENWEIITVDKNHNQLLNKTVEEGKSWQENSFTGEETILSRGERQCDILGEEVEVPAERPEPLQNLGEATTQQPATSDEDVSHNDPHALPQGDETLSDHNRNPQSHERTSPPLSDAVLFNRNYDQVEEDEEEKEEEEVEVDILLFSPVPQPGVCEDKPDNMDTLEEEEEVEVEEEEDSNEIDVTGDEAE